MALAAIFPLAIFSRVISNVAAQAPLAVAPVAALDDYDYCLEQELSDKEALEVRYACIFLGGHGKSTRLDHGLLLDLSYSPFNVWDMETTAPRFEQFFANSPCLRQTLGCSQTQACSWTGTCNLWDKSCANKCIVSEDHVAKYSLDAAALDKVFFHVFACPDIALLVKRLTAELAEAQAEAPAPDGIVNITTGIQALKSPFGAEFSVAGKHLHPERVMHLKKRIAASKTRHGRGQLPVGAKKRKLSEDEDDILICPTDEEIDNVDALLRDSQFEFGDVDSASYLNIYGVAISDAESLKKYVSENCKTAEVSGESLWYFRVVSDQAKALQSDNDGSDYEYDNYLGEDYGSAPESLTACRDSQGLLEEYETFAADVEVCADGEYDDPVGLCMALDVWQVDAECAPVVAAWVGASMDTPAITAAFKELSDACNGVPDEEDCATAEFPGKLGAYQDALSTIEVSLPDSAQRSGVTGDKSLAAARMPSAQFFWVLGSATLIFTFMRS